MCRVTKLSLSKPSTRLVVFLLLWRDNTMTHMTPARQQIGKHGLKAGIAAEAEVGFLGNGTQTPVSAATNINKGIPITTERVTEDN
jgi:hypothetical protein